MRCTDEHINQRDTEVFSCCMGPPPDRNMFGQKKDELCEASPQWILMSSYVFLIVVPEVECSDCPEQQQEGPGDEHRNPGLQQTAGGSGLHGHGGVGLR